MGTSLQPQGITERKSQTPRSSQHGKQRVRFPIEKKGASRLESKTINEALTKFLNLDAMKDVKLNEDHPLYAKIREMTEGSSESQDDNKTFIKNILKSFITGRMRVKNADKACKTLLKTFEHFEGLESSEKDKQAKVTSSPNCVMAEKGILIGRENAYPDLQSKSTAAALTKFLASDAMKNVEFNEDHPLYEKIKEMTEGQHDFRLVNKDLIKNVLEHLAQDNIIINNPNEVFDILLKKFEDFEKQTAEQKKGGNITGFDVVKEVLEEKEVLDEDEYEYEDKYITTARNEIDKALKSTRWDKISGKKNKKKNKRLITLINDVKEDSNKCLDAGERAKKVKYLKILVGQIEGHKDFQTIAKKGSLKDTIEGARKYINDEATEAQKRKVEKRKELIEVNPKILVEGALLDSQITALEKSRSGKKRNFSDISDAQEKLLKIQDAFLRDPIIQPLENNPAFKLAYQKFNLDVKKSYAALLTLAQKGDNATHDDTKPLSDVMSNIEGSKAILHEQIKATIRTREELGMEIAPLRYESYLDTTEKFVTCASGYLFPEPIESSVGGVGQESSTSSPLGVEEEKESSPPAPLSATPKEDDAPSEGGRGVGLTRAARGRGNLLEPSNTKADGGNTSGSTSESPGRPSLLAGSGRKKSFSPLRVIPEEKQESDEAISSSPTSSRTSLSGDPAVEEQAPPNQSRSFTPSAGERSSASQRVTISPGSSSESLASAQGAEVPSFTDDTPSVRGALVRDTGNIRETSGTSMQRQTLLQQQQFTVDHAETESLVVNSPLNAERTPTHAIIYCHGRGGDPDKEVDIIAPIFDQYSRQNFKKPSAFSSVIMSQKGDDKQKSANKLLKALQEEGYKSFSIVGFSAGNSMLQKLMVASDDQMKCKGAVMISPVPDRKTPILKQIFRTFGGDDLTRALSQNVRDKKIPIHVMANIADPYLCIGLQNKKKFETHMKKLLGDYISIDCKEDELNTSTPEQPNDDKHKHIQPFNAFNIALQAEAAADEKQKKIAGLLNPSQETLAGIFGN